ncbi:MAG: hypothetical protein IPI61_10085 [Syntrophaceae bacterium]|nr:hypothetical protein [Syntrophaceae bacterium]
MAEKIERESLVSHTGIMQMLRGEAAGETLIRLTEETFLTQESLIKARLNVIRTVDGRWPASNINPRMPRALSKEGPGRFAVRRRRGCVRFRAGPCRGRSSRAR